MRKHYRNESPSLTLLYGDDVMQDIRAVAAEQGLPVNTVKKAVQVFAPELLGAEARTVGYTTADDYAKTPEGRSERIGAGIDLVTKAAEKLVPAITGAVRTVKGGSYNPPATTTTDTRYGDIAKIAIPAGLGLIVLFLLLNKK